jgi:hypothetical protein
VCEGKRACTCTCGLSGRRCLQGLVWGGCVCVGVCVCVCVCVCVMRLVYSVCNGRVPWSRSRRKLRFVQ